MTTKERGALLGSYRGEWRFVAITAVFPLFALVVGGVQMLGAGRLEGLLALFGVASLAWVIIGLWALDRRATHLTVYEQAVVLSRPLRRERVMAMSEIRQVRREGGESLSAVLLYLRDGSYVEIKGFSELREIASLVQKGLEGPVTSRGWAPPRVVGPEPLVTWLRWLCYGIHRGPIWLDNSPESCRSMLTEHWGIADRVRFDEVHRSLLSRSPNAWDDLRAVNNLLAATRAGFVSEAELWTTIIPICQRLQSRYPSFEAVWLDYVAGMRAWRHLPADGSGDASFELIPRFKSNIEAGRARAPEVPFDLALSAAPPAQTAWQPPAASGWSPPGASR
jgi:hypothetical protein